LDNNSCPHIPTLLSVAQCLPISSKLTGDLLPLSDELQSAYKCCHESLR